MFLVQHALKHLNDLIKAKDKQIAKLEADANVRSSENHRLRNEKLTLLSGLPRESIEHNGDVPDDIKKGFEKRQEKTEVEQPEPKNKPRGSTL